MKNKLVKNRKKKIKTNTKRMYNGAGVLMFEEDNVILFREKKEGVYTEPGGSFDLKKHKVIEDTAMDEMFEETGCLFDSNRIETKKNHFDLHFKEKKSYRIYTLSIPYITGLRKDFKYNIDHLNNTNAKRIYLETNDVSRVNIDVLRNAVLNVGKKKHSNLNKKHEVYVIDEYNNEITLKRRTVRVLRKWFEINKYNNHIIPKKIKKIHISKDNCMIKYIF